MPTPPHVRIIGVQNSGKTALVEALVRELAGRGFRIGTIKHAAHEFEVDHPGKDTWRHRRAGSTATVIFSESQLALMRDVPGRPELAAMLARYFDDCDLVVVEGCKSGDGPAIQLGDLPDGDEVRPGELVAALPRGYDLPPEQIQSLADELQQLIPTPSPPERGRGMG